MLFNTIIEMICDDIAVKQAETVVSIANTMNEAIAHTEQRVRISRVIDSVDWEDMNS